MDGSALPLIERTTVDIAGAAVTICGYASDDYYRSITAIAGGNTLFLRALQALPSDAVIVDVGANIGATVSVAAALLPGATITALEPSPRALRCLRETVQANEIGDRVNIIPQAVGKERSTATLAECDFLAGSHFVQKGHGFAEEEQISVPVIPLDDLDIQHVDLIKIDVEGFELDVLRGATETIRRHAPAIVLEFNSWAITAWADQSPRALLDYIVSEFGSFFYDGDDGVEVAATDADGLLTFLHRNLTRRGCVDDILIRPHRG